MALKVVLAANSSWYLWNFRGRLISELIACGYKVILMAPRDQYTDKLLARHRCEIICVPIKAQSQNMFRELRAFWMFLRKFRLIQPDLYLGFTVKPILYGGLVARLVRVASIPTVTGLGTSFIKESFITRIVEFLYRQCLPGAAIVFFQNPTDKKLFIDRGLVEAKQARLCPGSGVDLNKFPYTEPKLRGSLEGVKFLTIGRLLRDKGIIELVEAAKSVKQKLPNTKFLVAGEVGADNVTALHPDQLEQWSETGLINYLGNIEDVYSELADADCVVLPSYREGLSRSLLEAAAVGRPIVTTDVPGCADLVDDEINGFLCEARNVQSLERALLRFIYLSPSEKESMGCAGRRKIQTQFSESRVVKIYMGAINGVLGNPRAS